MYQNQPYALHMEPSIRQFFETINPLNGFEGKDSLEKYMWEQSLKVEPKEPDKWDTVKPSRPLHVLKSPGIKPPKSFSVPGSSTNHYGGYRGSGRGFSSSFNTYSPGILMDSIDSHRPSQNSNVVMDDRNSHLGMVEINPGQQPRYLGDAQRGQQMMTSVTKPPPLIPRQRKEKALSTPPSPHNKAGQAATFHNTDFQSAAPPPLFPRRTSPQFFPASPSALPPQFKAPNGFSFSGPSTPQSPLPLSSAPTEPMESFVFPPVCSADSGQSTVATTSEIPSSSSASAAPAVPPRRKGEALPSPLPPDAVRVLWNSDPLPKTPAVSALLPLPPSTEAEVPPALFPRCLQHSEAPPPRPPKKNLPRDTVTPNAPFLELSRESSAPPLPPKTYKRRQRNL